MGIAVGESVRPVWIHWEDIARAAVVAAENGSIARNTARPRSVNPIAPTASRPVCTEMWPGNTADTGSLVPVVDRLRKRFSIGRVCIVADRGMISAQTIAELEARGLFYILGVRERSDKLADLVRDDPAPFVPLTITKRRKSVDYEAKAVTLAGRRYIVCRTHDEAKKIPPIVPRSWPRSNGN